MNSLQLLKQTFLVNTFFQASANNTQQLIYRGLIKHYYPKLEPNKCVPVVVSPQTYKLIYRGQTYNYRPQFVQPNQKQREVNWRYEVPIAK